MALHGVPAVLKIIFLGKIFIIPIWKISVGLYHGEIDWRDVEELKLAPITFTTEVFVMIPHGIRIFYSFFSKVINHLSKMVLHAPFFASFDSLEPASYFGVEEFHRLQVKQIRKSSFKESYKEVLKDCWMWFEFSWRIRSPEGMCTTDKIVMRKEHKSKGLKLSQKFCRWIGKNCMSVEKEIVRILNDSFKFMDAGITMNIYILVVVLLSVSPVLVSVLLALLFFGGIRHTTLWFANWLEPIERVIVDYDGKRFIVDQNPANLSCETLKVDYRHNDSPHFLEIVRKSSSEFPSIVKKMVDPDAPNGVRILKGSPLLRPNAPAQPSLAERRAILDSVAEEGSWVRRNPRKSAAIFAVTFPMAVFIGMTVLHSVTDLLFLLFI